MFKKATVNSKIASSFLDSDSEEEKPKRPPPDQFLEQDDNPKDEDVDPLDEFMADIQTEVAQNLPSTSNKGNRDEFEEEDNVESYVNHMKQKGIIVGSSKRKRDDEDSDAEPTPESELMYDSDDNPIISQVKKEIEPLKSVDHAKIEYIEIEKDFYEEHSEIADLAPEMVQNLRRKMDIHVSGSEVAKPVISFAHFGFDDVLVNIIIESGFTEPTVIQKQAVPVALSGRDVIGVAETGSGKTAAFLWPMLVHIMDQPELSKGEGPIGLVLAPTRELSQQIYTEAKKFAKAYKLKVAVVYGGASKMEQFKVLRAGVDILIATPGRLIDMVKMKAINLHRASFVVLDEADRMFDLGFEPQVRSICDNIRPDRQLLLFSATFPKKIEKLARDVQTDPVRITIGKSGQANADIDQSVHVLLDDSQKWGWLVARLVAFTIDGSVIIFVTRKNNVDELCCNLQGSGFECMAIHGDMMQHERDNAIKKFKNNSCKILVATDVAARGLDIKGVKTVVNYDVARDIDSHVHRIGRTGRAGEKGVAYTLITEKEHRFAVDLVQNLELSGQPVPTDLVNLARKNPHFNRRMGNRGGRGRGKGRRGGRGRGRDFGGEEGGNPNVLPIGGSSSSTSIQSGGRGSGNGGMIHFQKASSAQGGAFGLHSVPSSASSSQNTLPPRKPPKKSRWDK